MSVTVVSCQDSLNRNSKLSGTSDPFVVVHHKKNDVMATPTVNDVLNPSWKCEADAFVLKRFKL